MRPDEMHGFLQGHDLAEPLGRAFERRGERPPVAPRVDYVRWKSGTNCLLGLGSGGDSRCDLGYLKIFAGDDARVCVEKYRPREKEQGWVEYVPEWNAALFRFPLDRTVVGLGTLADMGKLKHVLHDAVAEWSPQTTRIRARKSTLQVIKYKPERRGLARVDLALRDELSGGASSRTVVAQAYAESSGATVRRVLSHLARWTAGRTRPSTGALGGLRVPAPLGYDPERRILVQEWCPGSEWGTLIGTPSFDDGCVAAAAALRELRDVPVPSRLGSLPVWEAAARVLDDLAGLDDPTLREMAGGLAADLPALLGQAASLPFGLIHGDFHYHQLLLDAERGRATLIDWDEARVGDPREDAGNLLAHFHLLELDGRVSSGEGSRLRDLFLEHLDPLPDLAVFTALQLVKLAFVPFRNLRPDWRADTTALLERAAGILAGEGARS